MEVFAEPLDQAVARIAKTAGPVTASSDYRARPGEV
jgi:hypothetical protein